MTPINLKKNILMGGSSRLIIMVLSFFSSWITARYLGVDLKGQYSYLITMSGFIWLVFDLGLYQSYPYLIRKDPGRVDTLFAWGVMTFFAETVLLSVLGLALMGLWNRVLGYTFTPSYMLIFIALITFRKLFMQLQSLYMGMDKIWLHSLGFILNSLLSLLLIVFAFFALRGGNRLVLVLCAILAGMAVSIAYFIFRHQWRAPFSGFDLRYVLSSYKFGIRVFISALLINLLIRADIILIKHFLGFTQVGIYSIAAHIVDIFQTASNVVGGLLFVKLSDTNDDLAKWELMKKMLMIFMVFLGVANLGFILLGRFVLSLLYGADFVPAYPVYLWLIPASFGLSFGSLFNNYLNSKGFPIATIVISGAALLLNIALNLVLIPIWGINGAAMATNVAYLLWFFLIIAFEQRKTGGEMLKHLLPHRADWMEFQTMGMDILRKAGLAIRRK